MSEIWYEEVPASQRIGQGDIFPNMHIYSVVPQIITDIDPTPNVNHFESPVIILTQACDLENEPVAESVVCAILLPVKGQSWSFVSNVLSGKKPALHIIDEYHSAAVNFAYHIVDFSDLYTVQYSVLNQVRELFPYRLRLKSPYLEYASQRFGNYFSRIGLPKGIEQNRIKTFVQEE